MGREHLEGSQRLASRLQRLAQIGYQLYFNCQSLKTEFSAHAGPQVTSFDQKMLRHCQGASTDLF